MLIIYVTNLPIVLVIIAALLVALALFVAFASLKGYLPQGKRDIHTKRAAIQFLIGLSLSLIGAFLLFNGNILGENTVSIARIIGIIGIGLIATSYTINALPYIRNKQNNK